MGKATGRHRAMRCGQFTIVYKLQAGLTATLAASELPPEHSVELAFRYVVRLGVRFAWPLDESVPEAVVGST
eukprot:529974-Amphidinium_carterae.1